MAESSSRKSQFDIETLKQTLCAQQRLLQKLYNDLDAEREASSTAASETLSMILRLQGEKAAIKMESEQYKRLAEEKMNHAEESLAIFEDVMYQKEMEVAAMDYQVQAYRYKLLSMGISDPGIGEIKFPETLLQRNDTLSGEINLESLTRRNSAPHLALKYAKKPDKSLSPEISEDCIDQESEKTDSSIDGNLSSYWEEIKNLDEQIKDISGISYLNLRNSTSRSSSPQLSSYDLTKESIVNEVDTIVKHPSTMLESSPNVLDVFEVPSVNCNANTDTFESKTKNLEKRVQFPNVVQEDESDLMKKIISSNIQCNTTIIRSENNVVETLQRVQVNQDSEIVEIESQSIGQESTNREEELRLLNEIREQLNSIQSQISCLKTNNQHKQRNDLSLAMLSEEMLYFWL